MWPFGFFLVAHYSTADGGWLCKSRVRHCSLCFWKFLWYAVQRWRPSSPVSPASFQHVGCWAIWLKTKPNEIDLSCCAFWLYTLKIRSNSAGRSEAEQGAGLHGQRETGTEREAEKETIDQAKLCSPVNMGLSPGSGMTQNTEAIFIKLCVYARARREEGMDASPGASRTDGLLDRNTLNACMQTSHACTFCGKQWRPI